MDDVLGNEIISSCGSVWRGLPLFASAVVPDAASSESKCGRRELRDCRDTVPEASAPVRRRPMIIRLTSMPGRMKAVGALTGWRAAFPCKKNTALICITRSGFVRPRVRTSHDVDHRHDSHIGTALMSESAM